MRKSQGWVAAQTGRPPIYSPGRPGVNQRETKVALRHRIAEGLAREEAALASGVSQPLGPRRHSTLGYLSPIQYEQQMQLA